MVEAFQKRWANHSSFKTGDTDHSGHPTFTVNHFNGPVTYSSKSFLERNLDALNPDFVLLFRGTSDGVESPGSIKPFVKGLFSAKAIATQAHPRNEDTIVSTQQPVKPMRAPSTRRKNTKRMPTVRESGEHDDREDEDITLANIGSSSGGIPCVAGEFWAALDTIFETLDETQPWFVFCVNPNDSQLPNQLERFSVKGQVQSTCLTEVAKRCATFFEVGMTPEEFCERYKEPLDIVGIVEGDSGERVLQAATAFSFGERDVVLGQHKVSCWMDC
jgi:chitin synthase